jgi:uncharacterized protein (DUF433 family)
MRNKLTPEELEELGKRIAELEAESRRIQQELAPLRGEWCAHAHLKKQQADGDGYLPRENRTVIRTSRGLTVNGTRLTLYDIRDYLKGEDSLKNIRDLFNLTDEEMLDILDYMYLNKEEFEKEYQKILELAAEHRKYWEEKNRAVMERNRPQSEATIARLREWSKQYQTNRKHEDAAGS